MACRASNTEVAEKYTVKAATIQTSVSLAERFSDPTLVDELIEKMLIKRK